MKKGLTTKREIIPQDDQLYLMDSDQMNSCIEFKMGCTKDDWVEFRESHKGKKYISFYNLFAPRHGEEVRIEMPFGAIHAKFTGTYAGLCIFEIVKEEYIIDVQ